MRAFHYHSIVLMFYAFGAATALASDWSDSVKVKVDDIVAKHFKNRTQVGVVVGVIHGDETHIWNYGERIFGTGETPGGDTFFEMGSITKTFTNTLLALEVNRGRVRLEDQVQTLWPELRGTDAGAITLEQLATHTSGLPRMPDNFLPADPLNPYKDYDEGLLLAFLKGFRQKEAGPYPCSYSNLGMGLLGHLIASKLNRTEFRAYLQSNLTGPLGMGDTKVALQSSDFSRAAQGYGSFFNLIPFWDLNVLEPAGVLKTTAIDLIKYTRFNMRPDSSPLGEAAELAQKPRKKADSDGVMVGLGWFSTKLGDHSVVTHAGATGGYRANLVFDREDQLGFVVLSNTDISPDCVGAPIFGVECRVPEWKATDPEIQKQLIGVYHSEPLRMTLTIFVDHGILGLQQDNYRIRLFSKSDTEFESPEIEASFIFKLDQSGQGSQFTLLQGGGSYDFVRLN